VVAAGGGARRPGEPEDADISELMAENLMLKAKLRLEHERQDELQAMLAEEIRTLRAHIQDEIGSLEELRAEQAAMRGERERFRTEREAMQAEREKAAAERVALVGERDALREERDLWRARTEALAQPLFQMQKR
jgi:chromosome segregation ATPase